MLVVAVVLVVVAVAAGPAVAAATAGGWPKAPVVRLLAIFVLIDYFYLCVFYLVCLDTTVFVS